MTCYWYDKDYKFGTCTYSIGDACTSCPVNGEVDYCPYTECGHTVAEERGLNGSFRTRI